MSKLLNWIGYIREYVTECVGNLALLPAALWGLYNIPFLVILWILGLFDFTITDVFPHKRDDTESINWRGVISASVISTLFWFGDQILDFFF